MPFATDHPSRAVAPDPNPAEKRAAALRALLARKGGTPVRTQFGQFNYRGSGYGSAVLRIAVEAGWLVEARRTPAARFDAEHDRVEYRYVELASAADVASPVARESKPETKRRTQRPTRKASTRQASRRQASTPGRSPRR